MCEIESAYTNLPLTVAVRPAAAIRRQSRRQKRSNDVSVGTTSSSSSSSVSLAAEDSASQEQDQQQQEHYRRECRLLASLRHRNVARLVGVCAAGNSSSSLPSTVLEHSSQGDLYSFLRRSSATSMIVPFRRLADLLAQVADGMAYLSCKGVVHSDLAARNVLLCDGGRTAKVTDVAKGISVFNADYSLAGARRRKRRKKKRDGEEDDPSPLRWQAWETIAEGRTTAASNAWSFGVTGWEAMTMCAERPMRERTDAEVVRAAEEDAEAEAAAAAAVAGEQEEEENEGMRVRNSANYFFGTRKKTSPPFPPCVKSKTHASISQTARGRKEVCTGKLGEEGRFLSDPCELGTPLVCSRTKGSSLQ